MSSRFCMERPRRRCNLRASLMRGLAVLLITVDAAIRFLMPPQSATGDNKTCGQTETAGTNPAPAVMLPEAYLPVRTAAIHLGKLRLRQIGQLAKSGAIMHRQVCQHLAIHLNVRPL